MRLVSQEAPDWEWNSVLESILAVTKVDPPTFSNISTRGYGSNVSAWWSITRKCLNEALESQFRHRYYATSSSKDGATCTHLIGSCAAAQHGTPGHQPQTSVLDQHLAAALVSSYLQSVPYADRTIRMRDSNL